MALFDAAAAFLGATAAAFFLAGALALPLGFSAVGDDSAEASSDGASAAGVSTSMLSTLVSFFSSTSAVVAVSTSVATGVFDCSDDIFQ